MKSNRDRFKIQEVLLLTLLVTVMASAQSTPIDSLFPVERFEYQVGGRRDPFVPLVGPSKGVAIGLANLNIDNLTLIGTITWPGGGYALVKDGLNNGYILKKGDKVAGGWVSQITNRSVIFSIQYAGVVTTYELKLQEKKGR
jgi:hypothetical protein